VKVGNVKAGNRLYLLFVAIGNTIVWWIIFLDDPNLPGENHSWFSFFLARYSPR
jgi:hypothetical protein